MYFNGQCPALDPSPSFVSGLALAGLGATDVAKLTETLAKDGIDKREKKIIAKAIKANKKEVKQEQATYRKEAKVAPKIAREQRKADIGVAKQQRKGDVKTARYQAKTQQQAYKSAQQVATSGQSQGYSGDPYAQYAAMLAAQGIAQPAGSGFAAPAVVSSGGDGGGGYSGGYVSDTAAVAETGLPEWALPAGILAGAGLLAFALMSQKKGRRR